MADPEFDDVVPQALDQGLRLFVKGNGAQQKLVCTQALSPVIDVPILAANRGFYIDCDRELGFLEPFDLFGCPVKVRLRTLLQAPN